MDQQKPLQQLSNNHFARLGLKATEGLHGVGQSLTHQPTTVLLTSQVFRGGWRYLLEFDAEIRRLEDSPNRSDLVSDCQRILGTKIDGQPQRIVYRGFVHNR